MTEEAAIWAPDEARILASGMTRFTQFVAHREQRHFENYSALHAWSLAAPDRFWSAVAEFCAVEFESPADTVLSNPGDMPGARWFDGARLNFSAQLLKFRDERTALVFRDEAGRRRTLTYNELYAEVAAFAVGLKRAGVTVGDRVAGIVPNCPEAVIAMLATTAAGAIWTSVSPDFGVAGIVDRFAQVAPKVLIAADGYRYNCKRIDVRSTLNDITGQMASVETVVVFGFLDEQPDLAGLDNAHSWRSFAGSATEIDFVSLPFDHPVYIMYSSGTTGIPKCIVHGAGGTLLQHLKEHQVHSDLTREDVFFFFTTCGWMMWNWLVSGLATGATLVLYDGSPFKPDPGALWRIADEEGITIFGTGAKYFAAVEKSSVTPRDVAKLDALRTIQSTGSPLLPSSYDYIYSYIKADLAVQSISGGTDLLGCFALGEPNAPVHRGELQCAGLGMAVDIFDDDGRSLPVGARGELVCTQPFVSMPVGFWNDPEDAKYRAAYFERFDNVWAHGDFAAKTESGGFVIVGRSDATLNPGGVRIGTAEIYRQVDQFSEIMDSVAIGQEWQGDTRIVLFVVMRDDCALNKALVDELRASIRNNASPRHVPAKIIAVPDIPRTRSGKTVELAVRAVLHGDEVASISALANPEALEHFRNLAELA